MSRRGERLHELDGLVRRVRIERERVPACRSLLVVLSGIDAAGKGYVAGRLGAALAREGLRHAVIHADGWLDLPARRFGGPDAGEHFYRHALRLEALFGELVRPLRERRSIRVEVDHAEETAQAFVRRLHAYEDLDVILLEGVFLLKRELRGEADLGVWIECSFETALERALARGQEGLAAEATVEAYRRVYFPAQRVHMERDEPRRLADVVFVNDARLVSACGEGG